MAAVSKWCHFELKGQLIKKKKKTPSWGFSPSSKHLLLLSKEERNYYKFGMACWWVNCHFLMNCSFNIALLCPKKVVDIHLSSHYIHTIYISMCKIFLVAPLRPWVCRPKTPIETPPQICVTQYIFITISSFCALKTLWIHTMGLLVLLFSIPDSRKLLKTTSNHEYSNLSRCTQTQFFLNNMLIPS